MYLHMEVGKLEGKEVGRWVGRQVDSAHAECVLYYMCFSHTGRRSNWDIAELTRETEGGRRWRGQRRGADAQQEKKG